MKKAILECCVDSVESSIAAESGGADRLELCANLIIGGTTPSLSLYRRVREKVKIPVNCLLRPRFGDFCYTGSELQIIRDEVALFREAGADGVVIGVLKPDGRLDVEAIAALMKEAGGMNVTLHRAFDVCIDPFEALEQCKKLGVNTILTSGQKNNCVDGQALLKELVEKSAGQVDILIGSGVNSKVIEALAPATGASSFHMSGKMTIDSAMTYRKEDVSMGLPLLSEYVIWRTSEDEIVKARKSLDSIF